MTIQLILADSDEGYAADIVRYIRASEWRRKFTASVITDISLSGRLRENRVNAILLATEAFAAAAGKWRSGLQILLKDEPDEGATNLTLDWPAVNKYQPADMLLRQVMAIFQERIGTPLPGIAGAEKTTRVIAVFAASGGSGKTTTALGLVRHLADLDYKVFYLNMEAISSFPSGAAEEGAGGFARVLYTLRGGHSFPARMGELIRHHPEWRADMFHPHLHPGEWREYGREDARRLLEALGREGGYDYVIVDLDGSLTDAAIGAILHCTDLLWLTPRHETGRIKEQNAVRALQLLIPEAWEAVKLKVTHADFPERTGQADGAEDGGGYGDGAGGDGILRLVSRFVPEEAGEEGGHATGLR